MNKIIFFLCALIFFRIGYCQAMERTTEGGVAKDLSALSVQTKGGVLCEEGKGKGSTLQDCSSCVLPAGTGTACGFYCSSLGFSLVTSWACGICGCLGCCVLTELGIASATFDEQTQETQEPRDGVQASAAVPPSQQGMAYLSAALRKR